MKIQQKLKEVSSVQLVLFLVFVLYIALPISTPDFLKPYVSSPIGLLFFFCITIALFTYSNPVLGVLYLFVVYEAIRRSSETAHNPRAIVLQYEPSQATKDDALRKMNPSKGEKTVEEEIIAIRAPINTVFTPTLITTEFKPIVNAVEGASPY